MGSYRSDDEALIGLARQLTDAYGEARIREDQDYACDSIAEFLAEFRESAPSEALLALLDLPLTAETYPLVDEAQVALAARGPAVVELLLEALLGEVYDPDGPAPERAAEALDQMPPGEASLGLVEVLCGRADDDVKAAAVDGLVALGGIAEPDLVATLDDPEGGVWAHDALEQIRFALENPSLAAEDETGREEGERDGDGEGFDDAGPEQVAGDAGPDDEGAVLDDEDAGAGDQEAGRDAAADAGEDARVSASDGEPGAPPGPASGSIAGPDGGLVDAAYEDFLRRFEQQAGDDSSS